MPFAREFSPAQQRIVEMADRLAVRFSPRASANDNASIFPLDNYEDLHSNGYLRLMLPKSFGGGGADLFDMVLAQEHLARGDASTALVTGMLISVLGRVIEQESWPAPILEAVCRDIGMHGGIINNCATEPELGSISRGGTPATIAIPVQGGWRISGHKIFVTGAPVLRWLVTLVVLPPSGGTPKGELASAIVRGDAPGLRVVPNWQGALSLRGAGNDDVFYDDVFVPDAMMVERRAIGAPPPPGKRPGANGWALPLAAVYLGVAQAASDAACDYANARVPPSLGRPIAEQPHVQQWIGEMEMQIAGARAVLHDAARQWTARPDLRDAMSAEIGAAKYLCTNAACRVTETALRVAGGFSLTPALPLERYFRDARAGLFQPPQDDLALGMLGRAALADRPAAAHAAPTPATRTLQEASHAR